MSGRLLQWDETVVVNGTDGPKPQTFTLLWYLNALCVRNGSQPVENLLKTSGEDFNLTRFRSEFWENYVPASYTCDGNTPDVFTPGARSNDSEHRNSSTACYVPPGGSRQLQNLPPFGSRSFALYTSAIVLTILSWPWHMLQCYGATPQEQDSKVMRVLMPGPVFTQVATLAVFLAASGLLTEGVNDVVLLSGASTPQLARSNAGMAAVWSATVFQLLGCLAFLAAFWVWRMMCSASPTSDAARDRPSRNSLPLYRPRDSHAADQDELPPYQRDDPMGNPPGIDSHVETRLVPDRIPLARLEGPIGRTSHHSGRETPSPEYQEHPVLPLSPLSRRSGLSIGGAAGRSPEQIPVPPSEDSSSMVSSQTSSRPPSSAASARVSLPEDMQAINRPI